MKLNTNLPNRSDSCRIASSCCQHRCHCRCRTTHRRCPDHCPRATSSIHAMTFSADSVLWIWTASSYVVICLYYFFFLSFFFNKFQVIFVQQTNFDVNAQCGRTKCVVFIQHNLTRKKNWKKNLYVKIIDETKARAHNCGQSHTTNVIQLTEYEWNQLNSQVNVFVCIFYLSIGELFYFEFLLYSYPSPFHIPWQLHNIFTTTESLATATELFDMDFYWCCCATTVNMDWLWK